MKLIQKARDAGAFLIDNWANAISDLPKYEGQKLDYHDHRLLIKPKQETDSADEPKPHIARLPELTVPAYNRTSTELAVSIPLFYSATDTHFKPFNIDRFQQIHVKGAVWAGISLLSNTDLGMHGVPLYFHIEDKAWDYAIPVFKKFGVPEGWLRKVSVEEVELEYKLNKTNFGKKYIGLLDKGIETDILLILDSDAFTLTENEPIKLYKDLTTTLMKMQPAMTYNYIKKLRYEWYVHCVMMSAGLPPKLTRDGKLNEFEKMAYERLGFDRPLEQDFGKDDLVPRYWAENYMVTFPKGHPVRDYTIKNISTCHCSPYIHAIWSHYNQPFLHLNDMINLPVYDFETPFIEAKKGRNCLAHIRRDRISKGTAERKESRIDEYYDIFYEHLTRNLI